MSAKLLSPKKTESERKRRKIELLSWARADLYLKRDADEESVAWPQYINSCRRLARQAPVQLSLLHDNPGL